MHQLALGQVECRGVHRPRSRRHPERLQPWPAPSGACGLDGSRDAVSSVPLLPLWAARAAAPNASVMARHRRVRLDSLGRPARRWWARRDVFRVVRVRVLIGSASFMCDVISRKKVS